MDNKREQIMMLARQELSESIPASYREELHVFAETELLECKSEDIEFRDALARSLHEALGDRPEEKELDEMVKTSEVYYRIGRMLSPFYVLTADWVRCMRDEDEAVVFHGRDSLGFYAAYAHRYGIENTTYSRGSRSALYPFFTGKETFHNERYYRAQEVKAFYRQPKIKDRRLLFVDFGYNGTLPMLESLILRSAGVTPPDIKILLAFLNGGNGGALDKVAPGTLGNFNYSELKEQDDINRQKKFGLFNWLLACGVKLNGFKLENGVAISDTPFWHFIQELPSFIRENRTDGYRASSARLIGDKTSMIVGSSYEIAAKYGFSRGLMNSALGNFDKLPVPIYSFIRENGRKALHMSNSMGYECLNTMHALYLKYPNLFGIFTDSGQRFANDPHYNSVITRLHERLAGENVRLAVT